MGGEVKNVHRPSSDFRALLLAAPGRIVSPLLQAVYSQL